MIKSEMRDEVGQVIDLLRGAQGYRTEDLLRTLQDRGAMLDEAIERLAVVLAELRNRPPVTRGKPTSRKVTPEVEAEVWQVHMQLPLLPQHDVGELVRVNQGRISEILAGKRT